MAVGTNRYADFVDMHRIFPSIPDYYTAGTDGTTEARNDLIDATYQINHELEGIPYIKTVPLGTTKSGDYDQRIKDICCNFAMHKRVWGILREGFPEKPGWINSFWDAATSIMRDIKMGDIVLETEIGASEVGISEPVKGATNAGQSLFFTNSDGYGGRFKGDDFRRAWVVEIDGTTVGNNIGQATFRWSMDNGNTWEEDGLDTGTTWLHLRWGLYARWQHGTGTLNQLGRTDRWTFETIPERYSAKRAPNYANFQEFEMG